MRKSKNRNFYHILVSLGTPLGQSRKTLHKWKDNSVLAKLSQQVPITHVVRATTQVNGEAQDLPPPATPKPRKR